MSDPSTPAPALTVVSETITDITPMIPRVDPQHPLVFMRRRQGVVGIGEALRLEFSGPDRMAQAAAAWKAVALAADVTDPVGLPGSGLIALGAFSFSDHSDARSVLVVPSMVIGRRDGVCWVTRVDSEAPIPEARPWGHEYEVRFADGELSGEGYATLVSEAVGRIDRHEVSKVVLARDLIGTLPPGADLRRVLAALALGYPDTHTYAVDGLIGSSPETLVRVQDGTVSARVLAGSTARGIDEASDEDAAAALATSTKDLDEHRFAVQSVLRSLAPHSRAVTSDEVPYTLKLPNLWHLATDVEGKLSGGVTSLDLLQALHPTAAVAGTPTPAALSVIEELEPFDRGRYAGPVGWVGADGDGEWAIALRGAQVFGDGTVRAYAGAGIVADSDPEVELAETRMKFRPIVEAFA
ncbi:isochorismate synthase [Diaminobutyricimonas sp. TR449]|uniref:isochorismate synthase n=1 Tax=Diaminobutyricimonas sp. TR449 TaxID=2708076 RepID=UPI001FB9E633|nr:isochorismate synthase [Diaminobutyricimonas sp. TR449]